MGDVRFDGQVAVVTGAAGGIGREHALLLGSRGAKVVVNDLGCAPDGSNPSSEPARAVVDEIIADGGEAVADDHSVATAEGATAMVQAALDQFGRLDMLVHNAGTAPMDFETTLSSHLIGGFNVVRAAWPHLIEQRYGRIVLTSSSAGLFGYEQDPEGRFEGLAYGAAKMGLAGLMHNLANMGRERSVHVNAIAPVAYTRLTQSMPNQSFVDWLERYGSPGLVSPIVAWLLHRDCQATGQMFGVGCGRVARIFVAETPGIAKHNLSTEDVRDHFAEITSEDHYRVLESAHEEMDWYVDQVGERW